MNSQTSLSRVDFDAAAARIRGRVRRTPTLEALACRSEAAPGTRLLLKLENLQPTGSFKVRGATNTVMSLSEEEKARGLITASGGNHGLGVAFGARMSGCPAVIYLPESTPSAKAAKLKDWGAEVIVHGAVWDDANEAAMVRADADGLTYIHPFADPRVVAGQGTIALEMLADNPEIDTLVVAIGGGGLIAGISTAAKLLKPGIRVIGVEPVGAPTHHAARAAGHLVTLDKIETAAGTLAPRTSAELNFGLISENVDELALVSDPEMKAAAEWLWSEAGIAAELSGAAALAALRTGAAKVAEGANIGVVVCGAGTDGIG
ncbi:threonine/serine dehydratase [Nisaea acidiphila]|uniref:Threonine/serine dehydratase n=1 Tax=Nisaea acidiphila TaxID=1862145 RepID=A0A9J7AV77_9PROT|nr:threonine/serine dehydratase [Nisaea acidiphila]UUX51232.1 threonine/serine dehydratase [Nisaea acidiphila]